MSATRWVPPDQREREEAERAAEEARRQEAAAGNIVERALQQMMHGTLAATAAAAVAKELEKPEWMAGDPAAFTAEQIAAVSRVRWCAGCALLTKPIASAVEKIAAGKVSGLQGTLAAKAAAAVAKKLEW